MSRFGRKSPRDGGERDEQAVSAHPAFTAHYSSGSSLVAPDPPVPPLPRQPGRLSGPGEGEATTKPCHSPNQAGRSLCLSPAWWSPPRSSSTSIGLFFHSRPRSIPLARAEPLLGRGQPLAASCEMPLPVKSGISTAITQSPSIFKPRLSFPGLSRFSAASLCLGAASSGNAGIGVLRLCGNVFLFYMRTSTYSQP